MSLRMLGANCLDHELEVSLDIGNKAVYGSLAIKIMRESMRWS